MLFKMCLKFLDVIILLSFIGASTHFIKHISWILLQESEIYLLNTGCRYVKCNAEYYYYICVTFIFNIQIKLQYFWRNMDIFFSTLKDR